MVEALKRTKTPWYAGVFLLTSLHVQSYILIVMSTSKRYLVILLAFIISTAGAVGYAFYYKSTHTLSDPAQVRIVVANFGDELLAVSLLAPPAELARAMDTHYAYYIHPDLLAKWKADPKAALGRSASSPYPDRVDITGAQKNKDGTYYITGNIQEVANGPTGKEIVNSIPIRFTVAQGGDGFQITAYQKL